MSETISDLIEEAAENMDTVADEEPDPELAGYYQDMADSLSLNFRARRAFVETEGGPFSAPSSLESSGGAAGDPGEEADSEE